MTRSHEVARLHWLDLLRTAAIAGMILYHTAYDLQFFYNWNIDVTNGMWKTFQVCVASLFLVVSGISAGFWTNSANAYERGWRRGWTILSAAMLVALVTAIADPETWVRFGILHLIAFSSFLLPFLRRLHPAFIAILGLTIALAPFDLMPHIVSVDYVPPIPWLGPILLGYAMGIPIARHAPKNRTQERVLLEYMLWPGRHSLSIYLVHQPVILAMLWMFLQQ